MIPPQKTRALSRAGLAAGALLALLAGGGHPPVPPGPAPAPQLRTSALGPAPARPAESLEIEGSDREYRIRWFESRHRAAPGVDWREIEAKNLQANLALSKARPRGPRLVWRERGPFNQTGATAFTVVAPDGRTLLVATSQGGVFSGVPGTRSWRRLADGLGGFVRGFTVSPRPEVWALAVTSLGDGRVYASRNRGAGWTPARGLPPLSSVYEMITDGDRRTVYLLARTHEAGGLPILARSRDGGLSFSVVFTGESPERPGIWTSRTAAGPLYLLTRGRLFVSNDQGSHFEPVAAVDETSRYALLRGSEAGGPTLYAAVGSSGTPQTLYASDDGGRSWGIRYRFPSTASFHLLFGGALAASISDPSLVLYGGVDGWRSTDGGRSFTPINSWREYYGSPADRLHADINGLHFVPYRGQEVLFLNTDGGTYQSLDGGASVQNLTQAGLPNAQFYATWSSGSDPDLYLAGSQDQGLQLSLSPGRGARPGAPLLHEQLLSGDYGNLTSASHDMTDVYAIYPTIPPNPGDVLVFQPQHWLRGAPPSLVMAPLPAMARTGFYAAAAADPDDPSTLYVGGDHIWKLRHRGDGTFAQERLPQSFTGGGSDYVASLAIAPADSSIWYAATFLGRLWYSRDRGATWTQSETTRTAPPFTSTTSLLVAADDPYTCYAGGSGYGSPPVVVTRDGGVTWEPFDRGLPSTLVWALAFDNPARQRLYAATEAGPYVFDGGAWQSLLGGGAPVARYYSVEGVPAAGVVRFGTFSRGIWDYVVPAR